MTKVTEHAHRHNLSFIRSLYLDLTFPQNKTNLEICMLILVPGSFP